MSHSDPSPLCDADAQSRHIILGTAGHIDHGKTSLIKVLTGTNTDRLPEERRRGMTIELGFAELSIGTVRVGVVDVPGHERFIRTMVAGATGIDLALIVVAADDSVMPQTIEHVEILHLLGISRAVVAVTKTDMVDPDMVELVCEEVEELLCGTPLADAPICPVSSTTHAGIDDLKQAIADACGPAANVAASKPFRMPIDRVFTIAGRGTVVTGSVLRGAVSEGDSLEVWPGGHTCRVRGLQTHGASSESISRGQRAAINVSGIDRTHLERGSELATPGYLQPAPMIDVRLDCLPSCKRPLKSTSVVRLEFGTTEVPVRVVLLDAGVLEPGSSGYAQLRSGQPIAMVHGQRFIIRDETAARTIGGGVVLRAVSYRKRREAEVERARLERLEHGDSADRLEEVLRVSRFDQPTDLHLCAWAGVQLDELPETMDRLRAEKRFVPVSGTEVHVVPAALEDLGVRLTAWLERHHRQHPELPGRLVDAIVGYLERMSSRTLAKPLFDHFVKKKTLKLLGRFGCLPAFAPSLSGADEKLLNAMIDEIRTGEFQPPSLDTLSIASQGDKKRWERLATLAVALGELVKIDTKLYLHAAVEQQLRERVTGLIEEKSGVTVAQVREALGSSRKFVVPFLEYLDRVGFTKRVGDERVLATVESRSK